MKRISKSGGLKLLVRLLTGIMIGLTLSFSSVSFTIAKEPVKLVMWCMGLENKELLEAEILPPVEKKYNLKIEVVQKSGETMEQALAAAALAREGCDFYQFWSGPATMTAAEKGVIVPLNDLFSKDKWDHMIGLDSMTLNGKIYMMPHETSWFALGWNKRIFAENGLTPDSLNRWEDFLDVCEKLKQAGVTPIAFADKQGYISDWWFTVLLPEVCDSSEQMIEMLKSGDYTNPKYIEALEKLKVLYDKGYFQEGGLALPYAQYCMQLLSEKVAMGIVLPFNYKGTLNEQLPGAFGLHVPPAIYPEQKMGLVVMDSNGGYAVTSFSKHPKEAALVIDELTNVENSNRIYEVLGIMPCNTRWDKTLVKDTEERDLLSSVTETAPYNYNFYHSYSSWNAQLKNMSLFLQGVITAKELGQRAVDAGVE